MKKLICLSLIISILAIGLNSSAAWLDLEIEYGAVVSDPYLSSLVKSDGEQEILYPPKEHPYIYLNAEYVEMLKANKDSEIYKAAFAYQRELASRPLPEIPDDEQSVITNTVSALLEAKAFMYIMGESSKQDARDLVDYTIRYLTDPIITAYEKTATNYYNMMGRQGIRTGSFVYDWCYDAMKSSQKMALAECINDLMYHEVMKVKPDAPDSSWGGVAAAAVGGPSEFNAIGSAAIYHEMPDAYEQCMPNIQGRMTRASNYFSSRGALCDESISYVREHIFLQLAILFDRMGHGDLYDDYSNAGYKLMYSRTPYGGFIKVGDDYNQANYAYLGKYINNNETKQAMGMLSIDTGNPYFRYMYMRENYNQNTMLDILLRKANMETKLPDDLPLSFYVDEPRSEIMARTSWIEGLDSPAVVGYMNMHNRRSGDHDHGQAGQFQLFYKGPLTIPGGVYHGHGWGKDHWENYLTRSISANCVTVYDKDEIFTYGNRTTEANDGGQMMVVADDGGTVIANFDEFMEEKNHRATTEAHYIGPNENTPAFSYIKGDLTRAYSANKMESYKRSMVFMDTFNETYPGVMVVFDKVVAKNASFPKKWLLQAVTQPEIEGNKITIKNTEDGCNGMLVNRTLYPKEIAETQVVGDINKFISDGQEWPETNHKEENTIKQYQSGIRCEVVPKKASKEDLFLNSMYVTDADGNAPELPMIYEETEEFMGVTTLDRMVMFSKSGEVVSEEFKISVRDNGYEKALCLITDVKEGKWKVTGKGKTEILETDENTNAILFEAGAGEYVISPVSEEEKVTEVTYPQMQKRVTGDFAVKIDSIYRNVEEETKLIDGVAYVPIVPIIDKFLQSTAEVNGDKLTVTVGNMVTTFTAGSRDVLTTVSGTQVNKPQLKYAPFIDEDGVYYINPEGGAGALLGLNASYVSTARVLNCTSVKIVISEGGTLKGLDEKWAIQPMAITASSDDGNAPENTIDRNLGTRWSSLQGDGEWILFDLGEEREISGVMCAFYYGNINKWNFDIQISSDGETFTNVLTGKQSTGQTVDLEDYPFPEKVKARYVRYVGHGEAKGSFYNSVTQIVIVNK